MTLAAAKTARLFGLNSLVVSIVSFEVDLSKPKKVLRVWLYERRGNLATGIQDCGEFMELAASWDHQLQAHAFHH